MTPAIKSFRTSILKAQLHQPFRTSLGAHDYLENVLLTIELDNGVRGLGEAAVATHITGETVEATLKNINAQQDICIGRKIDQYAKISEALHEVIPSNPAAIAAVEMALLDACTRHHQVPLWRHFGKKAPSLRSDITIVLSDLPETERSVRKYYKQGFRAFKVKIGHDLELDVKRLCAVKRLAGQARIYVDANQGYTPAQILKFLDELAKNKVTIDLLEQPVAKDDWEGLKEISHSTDVLVCADESVRTLEEAQKAIRKRLAPVINIKTMKCGLLHAQKIARLAQKKGIKLMIGGMMETSLSMTASAHLAAGIGGFDYIDLDTPFFIKGGWERNPYLSSDGRYDLKDAQEGIGLGADQLYD
jgi:L-alanine-DL-glutamate epimerase-like enolase superfamily enzyme